MTAPDDWRLTNQERYLMAAVLHWATWKQTNPNWDHDHCEFCWAKFREDANPDTLQAGYTTNDGHRWICASCFEDFRDRFQFHVEKPSDQTAD